MTPSEYCYDKAAIPGSALYFSTRKLDPLRRDAVVAIYAFYKEIEDITLTSQDMQVAQTKLAWWRNQVIHITENKATHPVAQMLQKLIPSFTLNPLHFISIIDGLEQNLSSPHFNTFEDVVVHVMRTAGTRECLIAALLQKDEIISQETIYQFSLVMELVNYLQHCRRYTSRGLILFASNELEQFKVTPQALAAGKATAPIQQLFQFQVEKIERAHHKAFDSLSAKQKNEIANIIMRSQIAREILKAIQARQYRVLEQSIEISPLRCWWISWRTAAGWVS